MNELKKLLKEIIGLTEDECLFFYSKLYKKEFKAKTLIVKEGRIANNLYFIESGILRTYFLQNGKEINTHFACDNQFFSTFSSFITQTPSFEYLEVIEDSFVYSLSFNSLKELYQESSTFEKLGRILAEKNYLCILDRTQLMQTKTAEEKYLDFIKNYDQKIIRRVPQFQIASFLGVAPESLSRIRKKISIS